MEHSSDSPTTRSRGFVVRLFATALCIIAADQAVKRVVVSVLESGRSVNFLGSIVRFTRTTNTGAAFGLLRGQGPWFIVVSAVASLAIILFRREIAKLRRCDQVAFGLILGGAIGNLIDRIRLGAVIDFIDIGFGRLRWPAFNVADSGISIGVVFLALSFLFVTRSRGAQDGAAGDAPGADPGGATRWDER
jgi:signal peptidase II